VYAAFAGFEGLAAWLRPIVGILKVAGAATDAFFPAASQPHHEHSTGFMRASCSAVEAQSRPLRPARCVPIPRTGSGQNDQGPAALSGNRASHLH
jgi:hypothetical protein